MCAWRIGRRRERRQHGEPDRNARTRAARRPWRAAWPPAARLARPALPGFGRRRRATAQLGARRHRPRAGCCRGCRSRSASASSSISPPNASRALWAALALAALCCVIASSRGARPIAFPLRLALAAVAAGFATATSKTARRSRIRFCGAGLERRRRGLRRGARGARALRPHRGARALDRRRRGSSDKLERVRVSVRKGTAPAVGAFVDVQGAAVAAARAAAARRL